MKIFAIIELPSDLALPAHCPDFDTLQSRVVDAIREKIMFNVLAVDMPRVRTHMNADGVYCGRCAAPLLASGACSSRNCPIGRQPLKRISAAALARATPGVKLGSTLKSKS